MENHQNKKHNLKSSKDETIGIADKDKPAAAKEEKPAFQFEEQDLFNKDPKDLKIVPTKVLLQCEHCPEPKRTFAYYSALKIHYGKRYQNFFAYLMKNYSNTLAKPFLLTHHQSPSLLGWVETEMVTHLLPRT